MAAVGRVGDQRQGQRQESAFIQRRGPDGWDHPQITQMDADGAAAWSWLALPEATGATLASTTGVNASCTQLSDGRPVLMNGRFLDRYWSRELSWVQQRGNHLVHSHHLPSSVHLLVVLVQPRCFNEVLEADCGFFVWHSPHSQEVIA